MPIAQDIIIGLTPAGEEVRIPRGSVLSLHSETRDWRRVRVRFADEVVEVSRAAWQSCMDDDSGHRRRRVVNIFEHLGPPSAA